MMRFTRATAVALVLLALAAGCGKKTMETPPPVTTPPVETPPPATPPPPPPPPPAEPAPVALSLNDVHFDYDSATLSDGARTTLTENGRQLSGNTTSSVTIEGHCDERGTVDYNLALGDRRAMAAKDFLVSYGVDAARLKTISYGENKPASMGHDEESWRQNRRAHFAVD